MRAWNAIVIDTQLFLSYSERLLILLSRMKKKKKKEVQLHRSGWQVEKQQKRRPRRKSPLKVKGALAGVASYRR